MTSSFSFELEEQCPNPNDNNRLDMARALKISIHKDG